MLYQSLLNKLAFDLNIIVVTITVSYTKLLNFKYHSKDTVEKMYNDIPYLMGWHTEHKITDQERTINFYKKKYPDWSIYHIMRMLDDGILPSNV